MNFKKIIVQCFLVTLFMFGHASVHAVPKAAEHENASVANGQEVAAKPAKQDAQRKLQPSSKARSYKPTVVRKNTDKAKKTTNRKRAK